MATITPTQKALSAGQTASDYFKPGRAPAFMRHRVSRSAAYVSVGQTARLGAEEPASAIEVDISTQAFPVGYVVSWDEIEIKESDADPTVKKEVLKELKAIPAEGLKTLSARLMEADLDHLPNAMTHLQVWLHQLM